MKQHLLNQIKSEANKIKTSKKVEQKINYWLNFNSLSPIEIYDRYMKYLSDMKFLGKIKKNGKIKIYKEPFGSKDPFIILRFEKYKKYVIYKIIHTERKNENK